MAKDTTNKDVKNNKHFFKDFKAELKKVIWPTPKQVVNNTIAVITIVIIASVIVFALDSIFNLVNEKGITVIKGSIKQETQVEATEKSEETQENSEQTATENNEANQGTSNENAE